MDEILFWVTYCHQCSNFGLSIGPKYDEETGDALCPHCKEPDALIEDITATWLDDLSLGQLLPLWKYLNRRIERAALDLGQKKPWMCYELPPVQLCPCGKAIEGDFMAHLEQCEEGTKFYSKIIRKSKCGQCVDGILMVGHSAPHPWVVIQRCDECAVYEDDIAAAKSVSIDCLFWCNDCGEHYPIDEGCTKEGHDNQRAVVHVQALIVRGMLPGSAAEE